MSKKILIITKLIIIICLAISFSLLVSPKSADARLSTADGWFLTTMTLENKINNNLMNGNNVIADITLVPSHDDEMQLRNFKITCNHNAPYNFNMSLRIKGGNELGTSVAPNGDFGFINHEFTGALYLEVLAEDLMGLVPPFDYIVQCGFNNNDIGLGNLLTGDIYNPNTEIKDISSPTDIKVTNTSSVYGFSLQISWVDAPESDLASTHIYRSTTPGVLGNLIFTSNPSTGPYNWQTNTNITEGVTYYYTLRSVDTSGNKSIDTDQYSGTPYRVTPISPTGEEEWKTNTRHEIQWSTGKLTGAKCDIELYKLGSFSIIKTIINGSSNNNYSWQIPNDLSEGKYKILVRCTGSNNIEYTDVSDYFSIIPSSEAPSITITSPNGGEQLTIGNTYDITWTSLGVEKVHIDISYNTIPGQAFTLVSDIPASNGKYSWTIGSKWPNLSLGEYKIRIFPYPFGDDTWDIYDQSDNYFSIVKELKPDLAITNLKYWSPQTNTPTIGSYVGYEITIKNVGNAKLEKGYRETAYYDGNYLRYEGGINVPVNPGESWTTRQYAYTKIQKSGSHTIKLVIDSDNSIDELDEANNEKTITFVVPPESGVDVLSPNGGEIFTSGGLVPVKWSVSQDYACKTIALYLIPQAGTPTGNNYISIANGYNIGGKDYSSNCSSSVFNQELNTTIPSVPAGSYKVGVYVFAVDNNTNPAYSIASDQSDAPFNIVAASTNLPDLAVPGGFNISPWPPRYVNQPITFSFKLLNQGNAPASPAVYIYSNQADGFSVLDSTNTCTASTVLQPGKSCVSAYRFTFPTTGVKNINVKLDPSNLLVESNENNNFISTSINIMAIPSIIVTPPTNISVSFSSDETSVVFLWTTPNSNKFSHVRVYQSTSRGILGQLLYDNLSKGKPGESTGLAIKIANEGLILGNTYYYTIRSVDTSGNESTNISQYAVTLVQGGTTTTTPIPTPTPTPIQNLPDNTLIKLPNDPKIYVIKDGKKKWIKTMDEFNQEGYDWSDVQETDPTVINAYADYLIAASNLIRATNQSKVYKIVDDKKLWIPTAESFVAMGNNWSDIEDIDESEVNQYPRLKLAKLAGDEKVYYLTEGGFKKYIPSPEVFNSYNNNWTDVVEITPTELDAYPNVILIKAENNTKVYKLENNQKRWIKTIEAFNRLGLNWNEIAPVNTTEINAYTEGGVIE